MTLLTTGPREAIILDVDGTLCDVRPALVHYRDQDRYHAATLDCLPNPDVLRVADQALLAGRAVFVVTARHVRYRTLTEQWLSAHRVPYTELYCREGGDPHDSKIGALAAIERRGFRVMHAWDDDPPMVRRWLAAGVPATLVRGCGIYG